MKEKLSIARIIFNKRFFVTLALTFGFIVSLSAENTALSTQKPHFSVCFTPPKGCTDQLTKTLMGAQSSVLVQAYSFTSEPIAQALVEAKKRGVLVRVLADKSQIWARDSLLNMLIKAGIEVKIDYISGIAHNKIMIIDGRLVITGSFNFTNAADTRNAENLLFIEDPDLAKRYTENWQTRFATARDLPLNFS